MDIEGSTSAGSEIGHEMVCFSPLQSTKDTRAVFNAVVAILLSSRTIRSVRTRILLTTVEHLLAH